MNNYIIILILLLFCSCCIATFICFRKIKESFSSSDNPYSISSKDEFKFKKNNYESTYGTLEKKGFKKIINEVKKHKKNKNWIDNKIFIDLGSGEGKVPIYGLDYPFKLLLGVELSTSRHNIAIDKKKNLSKDKRKKIFFYNLDLLKYDLNDVDLIYISSLCFNSKFLEKISKKLSKELKKGSIVCTSSELIADSLKLINSYNVKQSWSNKSEIYMYEKI